MSHHRPLPVIGFVAASGTGKTTLLSAVIPLLDAAGLRIAVIKRTHHDFEMDVPGKDSHTLRHAGARQVLLAGPRRLAWISECPQPAETPIEALLDRFDLDCVDAVLVEGGKGETLPKIEVHRAATGSAWLYPGDPYVIALATDSPPPADCRLPVLDLNVPAAIADFLVHHIRH